MDRRRRPSSSRKRPSRRSRTSTPTTGRARGFGRRVPPRTLRLAGSTRRRAADGPGDPQAPARLHRDRRPRDPRPRDQLLHRSEAAAADPDPRGEAVRAEGRAPERQRRRRRAGTDDPRRRRPHRRRPVGRARGRRRGRHLRRRSRVPAGLQRRDDAAAPDDRSARHVLPARPGHPGRGRDRGGRHDPGLEHRPRRATSTRSSLRSTPTPRPTCACCSSARARASTAVARTSASCSAAWARSTPSCGR